MWSVQPELKGRLSDFIQMHQMREDKVLLLPKKCVDYFFFLNTYTRKNVENVLFSA